MKPAGVILTYMDLKDWKQWWFNIPLLIGQLMFLIVGTAYGKIKWDWRKDPDFIDYIILLAFLPPAWLHVLGVSLPLWLRLSLFALFLIIGAAIFRHIDWRRVWRAAQCSHVRLCLKKITLLGVFDEWRYINFGYPKAEIETYWHMGIINKDKRFEYRNPTFDPSPEFIAAMIEYAEAQVGKRYDHLQLFSFGLNFIFWLWPPWWGQEKLKWLNLRGGREVCSSGITACLRAADDPRYEKLPDGRTQCRECGWIVSNGCNCIDRADPHREQRRHITVADTATIFFPIYDTAVVPPCLVAIDRNWEVR